MKIQLIFLSIIIILVSLFIFVRFYRPKEKKVMAAEANYAKALLDLQKDRQNPIFIENCQKAVLLFGQMSGKTNEESLAMMTKDIANL